MEVLAGDGYRQKDGTAKVRWEYVYDTNLDEEAVGEEYAWPSYIRAIQGHTLSDPDLMDRVEYTEKTGEFVYHLGHEKNWQSIVDNGLTPGWIGTRHENYLSAAHPRTGVSADPGCRDQ